MDSVAKALPKQKAGEMGREYQQQFVRQGESIATNTRPINDRVPELTTVPQRRHKYGEFEIHPQTARKEK